MTARLQAMARHAGTLEKRRRTEVDARHKIRFSAVRQTRPRLANVAVPLGIAASVMAEQWWALLPLGVCAWWWAPRDHGWEWITAVGRGLITAEWSLVGAYALGAFPDMRVVIGASWVLAAVLLAACAKMMQ